MKEFAELKVDYDQSGPRKIRGRGLESTVNTVLEHWRDTGCWWEGESEKEFYRVLCEDGGIREIFNDLSSHRWFLYRVYD